MLKLNRGNLSKLLQEEGFDPNSYSLYGDLNPDSIVIYQNYHKWEVFYLDERGEREMLNICSSEEDACEFMYRTLINSTLISKASAFFSHLPEATSRIGDLIKNANSLGSILRIWFDSIVMREGKLPEEIKSVILDIEPAEVKDRYKIHFFGSRCISQGKGDVIFTADYLPTHDFISVQSCKSKSEFERELTDVVCKYVVNEDTSEYKDFFKGKSICVGFRNGIHKIVSCV